MQALYDFEDKPIFDKHESGVRQTSIQSYHKLINQDKLGPLQKKVFDFIKKYPGCSDREIALGTNLTINCVCGRRNELLNSSLIIQDKKKFDLTTKRNVLTYRITGVDEHV